MSFNRLSIIILSSDRLDSDFSSAAHAIAKELAKHQEVYFLNRPYTYKDIITGLLKRKLRHINGWKLLLGKIIAIPFDDREKLISIYVPPVLPINWISSKKSYAYWQRINNRLLFSAIQKVIKKYNISQYLFLTSYNPFYLPFIHGKKGMYPSLNIYQSRDDISQDAYTAKHGVELEKKAASHADLVLVTSNKLYEKLKAFNPKTFELNNGVDYDLFAQVMTKEYEKPTELHQRQGMVIGYTGNLDSLRVDYRLLRKVATTFAQHTLLLVGPINSPQYYEEGIDQLPNVLHVGPRNITELPKFLACMDVVLIPFLVNEFTASIYPLKVNEYLAAGRSVVSTDFSKDIRSFDEVIDVATSHDQFIHAITNRFKQPPSGQDIEKRTSMARQNSWQKRMEQLAGIVEEHFDL